MALECVGGLVAEELHAVAALDQRLPSAIRRSSSTERISEPSCSFWLRFCACFIVVEFALDPQHGAVEEIDRRPEQVFEIGLEPGVVQRRDERVEDVGDGAGDRLRFRQRPRVGFVLEGTIAVELQFGENALGWGGRECAARSRGRRDRIVMALSFAGSAATFAAFMASEGGKQEPARTAQRRPKRSGGWRSGGYFVSRCKAPVRARRKIVGRRRCGAGSLAARIAPLEGRRRGPFRRSGSPRAIRRCDVRHRERVDQPTALYAEIGCMKRATSSGASCVRSAARSSSMPRRRRSSLKSASIGDRTIVSMPAMMRARRVDPSHRLPAASLSRAM